MFRLLAYYDSQTSQVLSRTLEWQPFGDVGSITVPMRAECHVGQLYYELTRHGEASEATRKSCFTA